MAGGNDIDQPTDDRDREGTIDHGNEKGIALDGRVLEVHADGDQALGIEGQIGPHGADAEQLQGNIEEQGIELAQRMTEIVFPLAVDHQGQGEDQQALENQRERGGGHFPGVEIHTRREFGDQRRRAFYAGHRVRR